MWKIWALEHSGQGPEWILWSCVYDGKDDDGSSSYQAQILWMEQNIFLLKAFYVLFAQRSKLKTNFNFVLWIITKRDEKVNDWQMLTKHFVNRSSYRSAEGS